MTLATARRLALLSMLAPPLFVFVTLVAVWLAGGLDLQGEGLSRLALGRWGGVMTAGFLLLSLSLAVLAWRLARSLPISPGRTWAVRGLYAAALGFAGLALVPTEARHDLWTVNRLIHDGFAGGAALLFPLACLLLARSFRADPRWRGLAGYTLVAGWVGLGLDLSAVLTHLWRPLIGLHEVLQLANGLLWLEVVALRLEKIRGTRQVENSAMQEGG